MSYRTSVDWAPAYELAVSLQAYFSKSLKTLELGQDWAQRVKEQGGAAMATLDPLQEAQWLDVAIWRCPGPRDVAGFMDWLATSSLGLLYELFAPYAIETLFPLPPDLDALRDGWVRTLTTWNEHYFRHLDHTILDGLAVEAAARREEAARLAPEQVVERATGGVLFVAPPEIEQVRLVPQYHYRPINIYGNMRGWRRFLYPTDAVPPGEPPESLLRLTDALGDATRLHILRFLAGGQRSFTDIVRESGLAKSTVHHHMVLLRAAGLVRLHDSGSGPGTYSLRATTVAELSGRLNSYFTAS